MFRLLYVLTITIVYSAPLYIGKVDPVLPSHIQSLKNTTDNYEKLLSLGDLKFLRDYSAKWNVDYRLMLSLIKQESRFDTIAVSGRGAEGLMQLMPNTKMEIKDYFSSGDTNEVINHLRDGIYYFAKLLELFNNCEENDRPNFALAAYNAGPSRIYDAQELAAYLGEIPTQWSSVRNALPLLSKRYYSLHDLVWHDSKPPNGYFGSWRQTISYVESVMKTYRELTN